MSKPLLSIVVPTKDRYQYLKVLISLIDSFKSDEIELVIQDNSEDNKDFLLFLSEGDYSFINYNYTKGQIPMSTNSDKAILNSNGEYICFIGDDDGVTIDIIECVKYMKANNIDAVRSIPASYYWPEVGSGRFVEMGSRVVYDNPMSTIKEIKSADALDYLLSIGFIDRGQLPLVYHGIVSRSALDKVFRVGGTFFPGSSPDISSGVALSFVVDKVYMYNKIVTFSGASKFHGGGVYTSGKKHPELTDIKWLLPGAIENWDLRLPKIGEGQPIWCDSSIKALVYMKQEGLIEKINFENLYIHFALSNKDLLWMSLALTKNKTIFYLRFILKLVRRYYNVVCALIWGLFNKVPKRHSKMGFNNTIDASLFLHGINNNMQAQ